MLKSKQNVYQSIMEEYKRLIEAGAIQKGEKLPSCRELALELGVNPNTVERAYSELEAEGYIKILPKKGAYADHDGADHAFQDGVKFLKEQVRAFKLAGGSFDEALRALKEVYELEDEIE